MNASILAILVAALLWGTTGIFSKTLVGIGFTTDEVVVFRTLGAAVYMFFFVLFKDRKLFKIKLSDLPLLVATGVISIFCAASSYLRAIEASSISVAAILMYTAPFFVVLVAIPLFQEKLTVRKVIALIIAFIGCLLVSGTGKASSMGIVYGMLAAIFYASYSIFGKFALKRNDSITVSMYAFTFAAIAALCATNPVELATKVSNVPIGYIFLILATGLITVFLPHTLYAVGLKQTEAGIASVLSTLEPLVATCVGIVVFRQIPTLGTFAGIVCIIGAIIVISLHPQKKA